MGLPTDQQGVLVEQVQVGSPADKAQLNGSFKSAQINGQTIAVGGDVITAIDNQSVTSLQDLQSYLAQANPGQQVTLTVLRDGKEVSVPVTLSK